MKDLILVCEYPKSGASWLVSMLGDVLDIPKRDVYITNAIREQWSNHFWFEGYDDISVSDNCVAKSHELPGSILHPANAKYVHCMRDGRDVVVSKFFYEKDFLVKNGLAQPDDEQFDDFLERTVIEWKKYVLAWKSENTVVCKYEDLLTDTKNTLMTMLEQLNINGDHTRIAFAIENNSKQNMRDKLGRRHAYNTFVRKGIAGDWRNYFSRCNKEQFKRVAGDLLIEMGYEMNCDW